MAPPERAIIIIRLGMADNLFCLLGASRPRTQSSVVRLVLISLDMILPAYLNRGASFAAGAVAHRPGSIVSWSVLIALVLPAVGRSGRAPHG